jgi:fumarate reductase flavoprotein subunit
VTVLPAAGFVAEFKCPVVIVGGGAAGLVAALAATEAGAEVLVIERDRLPSGSTALSAGLVPAAGTRWQAELGIADTPELFAADIMAKAHHAPDPAIVSVVTREAGPALEWLADRHGLEFSVILDFRYPGHAVCRMHGLPTRAGSELVDALRQAAERAGVTILCDARVCALAADEQGRVVGVVAERPDGSQERIGCDALVLACNGYGGNPSLVARHVPEMVDALYFGHKGNQGDAVSWGEALGAATRHLGGYQGHGSVAHPIGILITWATITEGGFQVNTDGMRFHDESRGYSEAAASVLRQAGGIAWTVFDARIAGIARQFADFRQAEEAGVILTADSPALLAAAMKIPEAAFLETFAGVAALKAKGESDAFGRGFASVPQLQSPLCAVRVTGALFHTQGGLVVDGSARVLGKDGSPLPNLLAAGGAACGVSGDTPGGYLSGNGLLTAVALGRVAGRQAEIISRFSLQNLGR